MSDELTLALQSWRKRRRNFRVLFGSSYNKIRLDWQRSLVAFEPGEIFGYERWEANKFGTQRWSIHVLKTVPRSTNICLVPGIKPGAEILLAVHGKRDCKAVLGVIDACRKTRELEQLSPVKWRMFGHQILSQDRRKKRSTKKGARK